MDLLRHRDIFDADKFNNAHSVAVIGCGATGSSMALEIAKLGVRAITLYDDDKIEPHNLCNQVLYGPEDIGRSKADIAALAIDKLTGTLPLPILQKVKSKTTTPITASHVFLCVDSMFARKVIMEDVLRINMTTKMVFDLRMNAFEGQVLSVDMLHLWQADKWSEEWYPDSEVEENKGACGTTLSVGATAHMATSLAAWSFIEWYNNTESRTNEILFAVRPTLSMSSRRFQR